MWRCSAKSSAVWLMWRRQCWAIQMPCASFTLKMIWEACQEVAAEEGVKLGKVRQVSADKGATTVTEINVCPNVSSAKAEALGFPMDTDLKGIIRDYIKTYIKK